MKDATAILKQLNVWGLRWDKIMAVDIYRFNQHKEFKHYSLRSRQYGRITFGMIRFYFRDVLFNKPILPPEITSAKEEVDLLFSKCLPRKDYDEFFYSVIDALPNKSTITYNGHETINGFNWRAFRLALQHLIVLMKLIRELGSYRAVFCFTKMIGYLDLLSAFRSVRPAAVVVFADMHPVDNMVAQYFRKRVIPTATMQHGLYVDYGDLDTVNTLNYKNVVSANFLAWGENTADIIERYHSQHCKTFICGKPTIQNELTVDEDSGFFTVLFDQKMYAEYNQQLLDIAAEVARNQQLKVMLKLHPTTPRSNYTFDLELEITEKMSWEKSRFCIGHTTSMIYEMLRRGMPVYQLQSDIPGHPVPVELRFSNSSELLSNLQKEVDYKACGKHFVEYIGQESLQKYTEAISNL